MDKKDIVIFVAVFAALGFSLYRKYMKKNQGQATQNKTGSSFPPTKDDDYEPYSKK